MQCFTCTALLGIPLVDFGLRSRGCHALWLALPNLLTSSFVFHVKVPQPRRDKSPRFRLLRFRSPLLTESLRFIFLRLLRCFTSPGIAWQDYQFILPYPELTSGWVVPFGNPRIIACSAASRGLSQLSTSFIAFWHQGIHRKPLVA